MIQYTSTNGGIDPVDFETAILQGRPADGGLFVPTSLPEVSLAQLQSWKKLSYTDLAFEILSLFIDRAIIATSDLKQLIQDSFSTFYHPRIIPIYPLNSSNGFYIQELFHGPTLSFKDVAMGFVVNLFDFFLKRRGEKMSIVVATSGDTGPATAHACVGKETMDAWVLYPKELITEEQERQMTTITAPNVFAVGVTNCPNGSDDLDDIIASLFTDKTFKRELNLSSVNSINWGRVMMQTVHYFYGYLQMVGRVGDLLNFSVPSGAFGNLCAGGLAREMGLPVEQFIIANNENACLSRIFSKGVFSKKAVVPCPASAIDIAAPINFWRYLYFAIGQDSEKIKKWVDDFEEKGRVAFDAKTHRQFSKGFLSKVVSDQSTLDTIKEVFERKAYLLDPHAAVAVAAAASLQQEFQNKVLCLATAHPCKFPSVVKQALKMKEGLPKQAIHTSIEKAKSLPQRIYLCDFEDMYEKIPEMMRTKGKQ